MAAIERDLEAAAGEAGEIAAWQAHDADRQDASRQTIHEAMMLSRLAGDRSMELFELTHLSMLSQFQHRPHETLRIADDVLTNSVLPPRVKAIFEVRRGRALAALGDGTRGFDALQRARSALAESISTRDPYWARWVDVTRRSRPGIEEWHTRSWASGGRPSPRSWRLTITD
ncbi:hypothetical protein AB0F88_09500 [Streptosporangium sp. NPDC023963]|uniref:hypothetical protein n=1 Tax=Streptosporangium sp. NPDC023963 TaxID=3155608 RepID=UPI0034463A83